MTRKMDRKQALQELAELQGALASPDQRLSMIEDWWSLSEDDPEWIYLSDDLRAEIQRTDSPEQAPTSPRYDVLINLHLIAKLRGVANHWLAAQVSAARGIAVEVEGDIEPMECCPCCGYRSLPCRHEWEICPVCFWEDDCSDEDTLSGANRMTLREARHNYASFGASSRAALDSVVSGDRYPRGC